MRSWRRKGGTVYKIVDAYDAISAMDQLFKASGYDMSYTTTAQYRADLKQWIIDNWMSADDFHTAYGY